MDSAGPGVYLSWPTTFSPIPDSLPHTVPPPLTENNFRAPFGINKDLYNFALRPEIPIVFAALYIATVFSFNAYNRSRDNQPWQISQQKWFAYFIVVHNVLLALYSFATFVAMFRAITQTLPSWNEAEYWSAKTADGLCKMNGPRGFGDAATFNTTLNIWEVKNTLVHVGMDGNPDPTDVGRLWNEGLAFWGWLFYVSKFYEVIDTAIILAKGKRSATLQTYHHAGAMLCMWAGIRYMSPPIWMFVFINSAIHAMMVCDTLAPLQKLPFSPLILIIVHLLRSLRPWRPGSTIPQTNPHFSTDRAICFRRLVCRRASLRPVRYPDTDAVRSYTCR